MLSQVEGVVGEEGEHRAHQEVQGGGPGVFGEEGENEGCVAARGEGLEGRGRRGKNNRSGD